MGVELISKSEVEWESNLQCYFNPSPPTRFAKGEGRVYLVILFPLLMGEGARRAGEGGPFPEPDLLPDRVTSEFRTLLRIILGRLSVLAHRQVFSRYGFGRHAVGDLITLRLCPAFALGKSALASIMNYPRPRFFQSFLKFSANLPKGFCNSFNYWGPIAVQPFQGTRLVP